MATWPTEVTLLRDLVAIPSVSGTEEGIARWVEGWARARRLDVVRDDASVTVRVQGAAEGPTLAFISHLDTVPPGEGWTRDPFTPTVEGDLLYGRGSGDAKASVAAMLSAAQDVAEAGLARGRLLVILGYGEETKHTTMGTAVDRAGRVDAAIVGEPTNLHVSIAQRGLMMVDLVARGDQRHAGYAAGGTFVNAAVKLARDLVRLEHLCQDRPHPVLGHPTLSPTMVEAGVSRNVTPPSARAVLDIRSTPAWSHEEIAEVLRRALESEVVVTSTRLVPCETPTPSRLLALAQAARSSAEAYGSPTCSDWVFVRDRDAIKWGPGTSRRSHTPDESVDLPEVVEARGLYARVARDYLSEGEGR